MGWNKTRWKNSVASAGGGGKERDDRRSAALAAVGATGSPRKTGR